MGRCTFRSILRALLRQSYLELATSTLWLADMQTRRARLMDFSLHRQTISSLSIILGQPSHRLTESICSDLFVAVSTTLPALAMDS